MYKDKDNHSNTLSLWQAYFSRVLLQVKLVPKSKLFGMLRQYCYKSDAKHWVKLKRKFFSENWLYSQSVS